MDRRQLEQELESLEEELEDVKQEKHFMLEKTNIHVPGHARHRFDAEIQEIEEKIKKIKAQLGQ
ncbi:hypothetical protein [Desulfotruncus alcoholivorax]|uniref:hypothetical protein n=1 Tax=Desulfotruncus alcoholivorax TaxID=265477 RepID=UPI000423DC30|nr:hypothetical protein [Desulfotruncus alcoholivorax]